MTAEPLRSAMVSVTSEDTSLVLPSDRKQCTGQQRVLQQVNTIKRSKSKMVKSDSIPSPTTPASATEFSEPKFQFSPASLNGTLFKFSNSIKTSRMTGHSVRRQSQRDSQMNWNVQSKSNGHSGSNPDLSKRAGTITQKSKERSSTVRYTCETARSMKLNNNPLGIANQSQCSSIKPLSSKSQTVTKTTTTNSKSEAVGATGATGAIPNIALKEAVHYLTLSDVNSQLHGASFIQHTTFTEESAKREVCRLEGIPPLIQLLKLKDSLLQQTAAAALRNLVYKDNQNKVEVKNCKGLEAILTLLRDTNETETQKQLTGLLWNLSSADELKSDLINDALPLLMENIVVPFNFWTDGNPNKHIDPEVFYNTTGCLRNLSCASDDERISIRNCPRLIDSLMTCVHSLVDRGEPDDKTVENCVCILHNLSYQLEKEAPDQFVQLSELDVTTQDNPNKNSLFSPKKTKTQKDLSFPAMETYAPEGVNLLYHQKSLRLYLSLLKSSQKEATLEACCGALQNLTASKSAVSTLMSQTIIQKLQGLPVISPLLASANPGLQKTAMSLVGNMCRVSSLRGTMAKEVLPNVSSVLLSVTPSMVKSDSFIATVCRVMHTLILAEPDIGKKMLNSQLIDNLTMLSVTMPFETARKAAGVLLWNMWGQKDFQTVLKKQGMVKDTFINPVTATANKLATSKYRN